MSTQLDSFETALLAELRTVVAARGARSSAQPGPPPSRTPRPARDRRRLLVPLGIAAAAVAAVAAFLVVPGIGSEPAYAITVDGSGEVHVRVHRLEDAAGLRRALEAQGIAADVTYLDDDLECTPGRYDEASPRSGGFHFQVGAGYGYDIELGPGLVHDGDTLVISASRLTPTGDPDGDGVSDGGGSSVSIGLASGEVRPCVPRPVTTPR